MVILDLRKVAAFCDYFVIASATSLRHASTIAQGVEEELAKYKIKPRGKVSRSDDSGWVVLDFVSVIVHVFYEPVREFYALESLWSDAKKVRVVKPR